MFIRTWHEIYWQLAISEKFKLTSTTENYLFKLLKNVEVTKASGIDQMSGKFLEDDA